ncbi:MAG: DUF4194 domain-containing protein [Oscillospiraceae bacterium]|nr:DUF4194 domain-containing protein [Oscillospiraceae bacterium]
MKIDVLDQQDLERTREVCQKLFHENYITEYVFAPNDALKQANEDYSFIMAHYQAVEELLDRCGWELCHDARAGVLYLNSHYTMAKMSLSQLESYILLGMRLLYDEKRTQASASGEVFVTAMEIVELLTSLNAVDQVNKRDRGKALRTLAGKNIVAKMTGKWEDPDVRLAILPSIVCALSQDKLKAVAQMIASGKKAVEEEEAEA